MIKVAAIGKKDQILQLSQMVKDSNRIDIIPFEYSSVMEAPALIEKAFMCDIYLFLEEAAFLTGKALIDKKRLPAVRIPVNAYMVLASMYRISEQQKGSSFNSISIDVPPSARMDEVLSDLQLPKGHIYTYCQTEKNNFDGEKIVWHHRDLWKEGKIKHALTSVHEVHEELNALHIPNTCMSIPKMNMQEALDQLFSIASLNQTVSTQIVAAFVQVKNLSTLKKKYGKEAILKYQQLLNDNLQSFADRMDASLFASGEQFILLGARALLDYLSKHLRHLPILHEMEYALKKSVDIGFGYGLTAKQATNHAQLAMDACKASPVGCCYIVNDRQEIIGPLGVKKHFDTSRLYHALIHKARLNNELSYTFIDFINFRNNEPFSSQDVATYYQVTKRSAERTIHKLLSGDVIKVVGKERPYAKGRPRNLFQINV
ncbi:hypothetical protein P5G51_002545 [Virgibacillus sp. 179-BFC.A HS]|uniref:Transcriptional regulator n=1 Tax=Tigheibacillus jepli TaxID=3035914 RepID=A0ABU5CFW3_9BACI|nr:hypothetical protein [Virgibacillus sp. 179-BFC.A HS]MDY0404440.1 hypothetical protein [Virgibacillus sp. 179-BFC.A HS]